MQILTKQLVPSVLLQNGELSSACAEQIHVWTWVRFISATITWTSGIIKCETAKHRLRKGTCNIMWSWFAWLYEFIYDYDLKIFLVIDWLGSSFSQSLVFGTFGHSLYQNYMHLHMLQANDVRLVPVTPERFSVAVMFSQHCRLELKMFSGHTANHVGYLGIWTTNIYKSYIAYVCILYIYTHINTNIHSTLQHIIHQYT